MQFAAIRHLSVDMDNEFTWIQKIRCCSTTLQSLELRGCNILDFTNEPKDEVVLPILQCLTIGDDYYSEGWSLRARTPALTSLVVKSCVDCLQNSINVNTGNVTHLRLPGHWVPINCPAVRVIQLDFQN